MKNLLEYINYWYKNERPCNEDLCINLFIEFFNTYKYFENVSFNGNGYLFGKQISIYDYSTGLSFDCTYSFKNKNKEINGYDTEREKISIYPCGCDYYTDEYILIQENNIMFSRLKESLLNFLIEFYGIGEMSIL